MAVNDIQIMSSAVFGSAGSIKYTVAAGATAINAGEPVVRSLGAPTVTAMATNKPVVATDFVVGIAMSNSTQTASADGTVEVQPLIPGQVYLIKPKVAATWDTQAEYDALVGDRVLIDLTSGNYTILATDGATNGCVVMPLDISKYPNLVAFCFRNGCSDLT